MDNSTTDKEFVSTLQFQELKLLKEADDTCAAHGINLVYAENRQPFCPKCAQERIVEREKASIEAQTEALYRKEEQRKQMRTAAGYLAHRSLIADETIRDANFKGYIANEEEEVKNKRLAGVIAQEYIDGAVYNTLFTGNTGSGKSHLAMSMLKMINKFSKPQKKCLFISVDEMFRRIKGSWKNSESEFTEENMVDLLSEVDVLVLDDIGSEIGSLDTEKESGDFTTKILYAILSARQSKPTIITTNFNASEMADKYDQRILSRMHRGAKGHIIIFKETEDKRMEFTY